MSVDKEGSCPAGHRVSPNTTYPSRGSFQEGVKPKKDEGRRREGVEITESPSSDDQLSSYHSGNDTVAVCECGLIKGEKPRNSNESMKKGKIKSMF